MGKRDKSHKRREWKEPRVKNWGDKGDIDMLNGKGEGPRGDANLGKPC